MRAWGHGHGDPSQQGVSLLTLYPMKALARAPGCQMTDLAVYQYKYACLPFCLSFTNQEHKQTQPLFIRCGKIFAALTLHCNNCFPLSLWLVLGRANAPGAPRTKDDDHEGQHRWEVHHHRHPDAGVHDHEVWRDPTVPLLLEAQLLS